jgi:hypothetical protein
MEHFPRYCLICTAVLAMTVLAISVGQRRANRTATLPSLKDWDIPTLANHLNRAGLNVQLLSPSKDGSIALSAFLTTTHKDWEELNRLGINPGPSRIKEWRGIVYCERAGQGEPGSPHWENHSLVVGPFLFYGDAELLERIAVLLVPSAPSAAP